MHIGDSLGCPHRRAVDEAPNYGFLFFAPENVGHINHLLSVIYTTILSETQQPSYLDLSQNLGDNVGVVEKGTEGGPTAGADNGALHPEGTVADTSVGFNSHTLRH